MIFVTVGQMLGFDRLIMAMDRWAERHPDEVVFAQVGDGRYKPKAMRWTEMVPGATFKSTVAGAELIVAHAGMGSFFVAMEMGKPIVMMARRADLGEHTTDHQIDTLKWLREKPQVFPADAETDLPAAVSRARAAARERRGRTSQFQPFAPPPFIAKLRAAILS
jgi:UDP-N-acetylglucosamine transferase subunit ALG13